MTATGTATRSIAGSTRSPRCQCCSASCCWPNSSHSEGLLMERYFAPCPRGLEGALATELGTLAAGDIAPTDGGVAFAGPLDLAYRANLESRLASRVFWCVGGGAFRG